MFSSILIALIITAILLSLAALIIGCVALTFIIGVKNSTHQVVWKEADPAKNVDPFADEIDEVETVETMNPNTRFKKFENADALKTEDEFRDLDDPSISSNFA